MGGDGSYNVLLTDEAANALKKTDKPTQERLKKRIAALSRLQRARTLKKHPDIWVLEIGDWRALYLIDEKEKAKKVFFIGDHKEYEKRYMRMFK